MAWLKTSDRSAMHPFVLRIRRTKRSDQRSVNEVYGFVSRCATMSAQYSTDYLVDLEVAEQCGLSRTGTLLDQAVEAGLMRVTGRGRTRRWVIVEDDDLWHIRAREDIEWERQRDRDRRNPELTMRAKARDGDQCRYCLVVVVWKDTRSNRGGTFDHRQPGQAAVLEDYVVCCRRCNSIRKDKPNADQLLPLKPAPPLPYFSPASRTRAEVEDFLGRPVRAANDPYTPADAAIGAHPGSTADDAAQGAHSASQQGTAASGATLPTPADAASGAQPQGPPGGPPTTVVPPWSEGGTRDGTGQDGSGQVGTGAPTPQPVHRHARGSRGRRGSGATGGGS